MAKILFLLIILFLTPPLMAQKHKYLNTTTFGVLAGTSSDMHEAPLSVISEHHYRFNDLLSAGLMTGIEQLNENTLPACLSLRYYIPAGSGKYFLSGYGGYNISLEKPPLFNIKKGIGGKMAGIETGFFIPVNSCASIVIGIGYRYNEMNYQLDDIWIGNYRRKYTFNRFSARIGLAIF